MTALVIKKLSILSPKKNAYLLLVIAQLMVAINVIGSKVVVSHASLLSAIFLRFFFATAILGFLYLWQGDVQREHFKLPKKHWFMLISQGLCAGFFFNLFILLGVNYTSASMAGMLISLLPAVIAISAMIFLKEQLSYFQKVGILLAMVGLVFINRDSLLTSSSVGQLHQLLGIFFLILALVPETAYYLLSKICQIDLPILVFSGLLNCINVICLLPILLVYEPSFISHIDQTTLQVLFGTGIASALFYICWSKGIKEVSATKAGMLTALSPLMTLVIAAIFLGETISFSQMIGMFFVLLSIWLSHKKKENEIS